MWFRGVLKSYIPLGFWGPGLGVASEATADPEDAASYYQGLVTASAGRSDEAAKKDPTGDLQLG